MTEIELSKKSIHWEIILQVLQHSGKLSAF